MKLLFSEAEPDYSQYLYPYVIWAVPEAGETAPDFFAAGFLPASPQLDRYVLCRQLRVPLAGFASNSENRRILRKGEGIVAELVPRADFDYSSERRTAWLAYAAQRFGEGIMPAERLDTLMGAPVISHLLVFCDTATQREVGTVLLYLAPPQLAFYYYAFYDLAYQARKLGMYMMTAAVQRFARDGFQYIHLGTCYSERALYKIQFDRVEFFNGFRWSRDLSELKRLLRRNPQQHLLVDPDFQALHGGLRTIAQTSRFHCSLSGRQEGSP